MFQVAQLRSILADLRIGISFATVLPFGPANALDDGGVTRATWSLPIAGLP
jgi:adenosylcobinamide-GDP ribazoletransferase